MRPLKNWVLIALLAALAHPSVAFANGNWERSFPGMSEESVDKKVKKVTDAIALIKGQGGDLGKAGSVLETKFGLSQICPGGGSTAYSVGDRIYISKKKLCDPKVTVAEIAALLVHEHTHIGSTFKRDTKDPLCKQYKAAQAAAAGATPGSKKAKQLEILRLAYRLAKAIEEVGADLVEHGASGGLGVPPGPLADNKKEICRPLDRIDDPGTTTPDTPDGPQVTDLCSAIANYEAPGGSGSGAGLAGFDIQAVKDTKDALLAQACKHRKEKTRQGI